MSTHSSRAPSPAPSENEENILQRDPPHLQNTPIERSLDSALLRVQTSQTTTGPAESVSSRRENSSAPQIVKVNTMPHQWFDLDKLTDFNKLKINIDQARRKDLFDHPSEHITPNIKKCIIRQLRSLSDTIPDHESWENWSDEVFFRNMSKAFGELSGVHTLDICEQMSRGIKLLKFFLDPKNTASWFEYVQALEKLITDSNATGNLKPEEEKSLVKELIKNLCHAQKTSEYAPCVDAIRLQLTMQLPTIPTMTIYLDKLIGHCNTVTRLQQEYAKYKLPGHVFITSEQLQQERPPQREQPTQREISQTRGNPINKRSIDEQAQSSESRRPRLESSNSQNSSSRPQPEECKGCGHIHGPPCRLSGHPDFNHSDLPWAESITGRQWAAKGRNTLPVFSVLDKTANPNWVPPQASSFTRGKSYKGPPHKK